MHPTAAILLLSLLLLPADAQSVSKTAVDRVLAGAPAEDSAAAWFPVLEELSGLGKDVRAHLEERRDEDAVRRALKALDHLEGRDLLQGSLDGPVPRSPGPVMIAAGEILLLRKGEWRGALRVAERQPEDGKLAVSLWTEFEAKRPLAPRKAEERVLEGEVPERFPPGLRQGFSPLLHRCALPAGSLELLAQGPGGWRVVLPRDGGGPESLEVLRTGETSPRRVRPARFDTGWIGAIPPGRDAALRRVQLYLFRLLPLEPLPTFGTSDEERYAFAEAVQAVVRRAPTARDLLVIVLQPPGEEFAAYTSFRHDLLLRFAAYLGFAADDVLVQLGNREPREANPWYQGGRFRRPDGKLRKLLRVLFPEEL